MGLVPDKGAVQECAGSRLDHGEDTGSGAVSRSTDKKSQARIASARERGIVTRSARSVAGRS